MELSLTNVAELLFLRTHAGYAAVAGACFLALLVTTSNPGLRRISAAAVWVCAFTLYDVFGYDFLVMTDSTAVDTLQQLPSLGPAYAASLNAYRILQITLQTVLTAMVWFAAGRRAAAAALLLWWGGVCDVLYYALTMRELPLRWDWMWFTPVGIFVDVLPLWLVMAQAGMLCLLAGLLLASDAFQERLMDRGRTAQRFIFPLRRSRWPR